MRSLKPFLSLFLAAVLLFAGCRKDDEYIVPIAEPEDIVILFDNDPHCAIEGYAKMAWLKQSLLKQTSNVCVVSCGDFLQGDVAGTLSQGEYPITLMNAVGYDFVTLGNHEFDYGVDRLMELTSMLHAEVLCANFVRTADGNPVYAASTSKVFGNARIAFVGVTTPQSVASSTPAYFQDGQGNYVYSFCNSTVAEVVQAEVDRQRRAGADYVVLLSHLGDYTGDYINSQELIAATSGIDLVLDGHAHNIIPLDSVRNSQGTYVKRTSTGSSFEYIGKVTISTQGDVSAELLPCDELDDDSRVKQVETTIQQQLDATVSEVLGKALFSLPIADSAGHRLVRNHETAIGDFAADAFRDYFQSDIGWVNGGAIRASLNEGTVTFGDILVIFPFGSQAIYGTISGQALLDNLEMAYRKCPVENGGFAQLSGVRCEVDTTIPSSVTTDADGMLLSIGSTRRVSNVQVLSRTSGQYEALDPARSYTIAGSIYVLQDHGDGQDFGDIRFICDHDVLTDAQILARYAQTTLSGIIGTPYNAPQGRITFHSLQ